MIFYKLKNLSLNKNVVFFIICYSIRSEFITEAATDKVLQKSCSAITAKRLKKTSLKNLIFLWSCLLEVSNFV